MNKLRNTLLAVAAAVALSSCFLDSIEPWLEADSIMPAELDLEGDWSMANGEFKNKYKVELSKDRSSRSKDKQNYYIKVLPQLFDSSFNFRGAVHQVNGIKLLQITNFSHFGDDVFSLANRPTISLWQIAYDADNIIIWAPRFVTEAVGDLKTMQDSNDNSKHYTARADPLWHRVPHAGGNEKSRAEGIRGLPQASTESSVRSS